MDENQQPPSPGLSPDTVAQARAELGDEPAMLLPCLCRRTGNAEVVLVVSEKTAEGLAGMLGYFGLPETVAIFAATCTADLSEDDLAALVGGDRDDLRAEIERMVEGGLLVRWEDGGTAYFSAGNPTLKRFFLSRYAPERKKPF